MRRFFISPATASSRRFALRLRTRAKQLTWSAAGTGLLLILLLAFVVSATCATYASTMHGTQQY